MQLLLSLKEMSRRRIWVAAGLIVAVLLAVAVVFQVRSILPPSLKSREKTVWVASSQVLVDARSSAIGNLNQGLDPLIPRATVYANLMTSQTLVDLIGQAAQIPASKIAVAGPIGTNGQRPTHGASSPSPNGQVYSLQLDTDETQPIIRISAQAPTSHAASALAIGAATGLATYVSQLENAQQVSIRHRVDLRPLGEPAPSATASGIAPVLFIPIALILMAVSCMFVLFASRFAEAWREETAPSFPQSDWTETDMPAGYDDDLSAYPTLEPELDEAQLYRGDDDFDFEWEPEPDGAVARLSGPSANFETDQANGPVADLGASDANGHAPDLGSRRPAWLQRRTSGARPK